MIERDQTKNFSNEDISDYLQNYIEDSGMSGTFPNLILEAAERLKEYSFKASSTIKIGKRTYHYVSSFVDNLERMLIYKTWDKNRRQWCYSIWNYDEDFK